MKFPRPLVIGLALLTAAGAGYAAFQDGTRFPGERQATTSVVVDGATGDAITLTYNTLQFGPQVTQMMLNAPAEQREGMAMRFVPSRLRGTFQSDAPLQFGDQQLAGGSYGVTFLATDDGGVAMRFLTDGKTALEVPCESRESSDEHRFLNFNLRSTGAESFHLQMDYGTLKAGLDFELAPESMEEEEEEEEEGG